MNKRVLLIEPDRLLAATYAGALEHAGYAVARVHTAQAAIEAADADKPDVIVLELQLAGEDGIAFLHELRSYPEWRQIPVVVQTSLAPARMQPLQAALAADLGVVTVLYKTAATLKVLVRTLQQAEGMEAREPQAVLQLSGRVSGESKVSQAPKSDGPRGEAA